MRSGTEIEKNDFKVVMGQFTQLMQTVDQGIEDLVKTRQQKVAESLKVAKLENAWILKIDDKLILGVDIPNCSSMPGFSIALNPWQKKRKQNNDNTSKIQPETTQNAVFITNSFWDITVGLANTFCYRQEAITTAPTTISQANFAVTMVITPTVTTLPGLTESNKLSQQIDNLEKKVDNVVGNIEAMIGKIMQVLAEQNIATELGPPTI